MNVDRISSVFKKFDSTNSGTISRQHLQEVLEAVSRLTPDAVEALLAAMCDSGEDIVVDDFLAFLAGSPGAVEVDDEQTHPEDAEAHVPSLRDITGETHQSALEIVEQDTPEAPTGHTKFRGKAKQSRASRAGLVALVAGALRNHGWGAVEPDDVAVEDKSACGGSTTFKMTAKVPELPSVALHSRSSEHVDDLGEVRSQIASRVYAEHGVAPVRLAQGADWFIEAWAGDAVGPVEYMLKERPDRRPLMDPPKCSTAGCNFWTHAGHWNVAVTGGFYCCKSCARGGVHARACQRRWYNPDQPIEWEGDAPDAVLTSCEELAGLLARIHNVPTDWFDEVRDALRSRCPALREAAVGSHVWYYTARRSLFEELTDEGKLQWSVEDGFAPVSAAGARVVSCHGDFHCRNILKLPDGQLRAVVTEFACVAHAIQDVSWALSLWLREPEAKRRFGRAYLAASGLPSEPDDVHAFLVDCEIGRLGVHGPAWAQGLPRKKRGANPELYRVCMKVAAAVRSNTGLQEEVLEAENGFIGFLRRHPDFCAVAGTKAV